MPTSISNKKFTLLLHEKGYYELTINEWVEIDIADIKEIVSAQRMVSGKVLPVMVIGGQFSSTNIETLKYLAKNSNMPFSKASAFILKSTPQRLFGDFYLKFYKPERPTRFFKNREEAEKWVIQFV
ncbi:MAG: hypothetical protein K0R26_1830 [Bacteroidota bacterium]|nr:hypothetical protein [Bacteroidota bacterium]